jgi:hypothetical protein
MQVNTGNTTAYFDGGVLCQGDSSYTILTESMDIGEWKTVNRYVQQTYAVPRREGLRVPNSRIESKTLTSTGMFIGTTPTAKRTNFDTVMKVLNNYEKKPNGNPLLKNLFLYDDRYYKCFVTSADPDEKAATRIADVRLRFNIPEPFWCSTNWTRVNQSLSGDTTFTVTPNGTAVSRPVITVTNSSSNITSLTIENLTSGQKFNYSGTLATGQDLVIDTDELTVENNGANDLGNVTNEVGMTLLPQANEFKVTGVASGDIDIDWCDRWY